MTSKSGDADVGRKLAGADADVGRKLAGADADVGRKLAGADADVGRKLAGADADVGRKPRRVVVVLGAGLAGLAAAQVLLDDGHSVTVVDKGRGVGGRLATRRIDSATLDHGAQFFTVRGDAFRSVVADALSDGVIDVWCYGFDSEDGFPRYRGTNGMNAFAKWLAARVEGAGGTIMTDTRIDAISTHDSGWRLQRHSGIPLEATDVIVTAPVPQALELFENGDIDLDPILESQLQSITYKPTLALMVTLDNASAVPPPGGVQQTEDDLFTFIADNQQKGLSASPALTFHVNGTVTAARWDDPSDDVIADLLVQAQPWIGDAAIIDAQLKKWKYAGPRIPHPDPCVIVREDPGLLVLAGDAFAGPKVEGAFNSGQAAGTTVLSA